MAEEGSDCFSSWLPPHLYLWDTTQGRGGGIRLAQVDAPSQIRDCSGRPAVVVSNWHFSQYHSLGPHRFLLVELFPDFLLPSSLFLLDSSRRS